MTTQKAAGRESQPHVRPHRTSSVVAALAALVVAVTVSVVVLTRPPAAQALENGVARTPPMGWNTWNTFGCNINETLIRQTADALVANGMRDLGYQYVVVDDCWFNPNRDASGNLQGHPTRFPSGMKALGDYIHSKGLKFGIYQVPVDKTCAQYFGAFPGATGSRGHEYQDARQFAAWGVDFLKYDWCSPSGTIDDQVRTFALMRDALAATGRPIVYSINSNSIHAKTGRLRNWGDVANMWRTTEDITNRWDTGSDGNSFMGVKNIIDWNVPLAGYARPGGFNDPDMMEVGNGGITDTEQRSHFAMWAIMAAPLIAGNDVRNASAATLTILKNQRLIAINQDPLGLQGVQVAGDASHRVLAKRLANGDVAVALFNQSSTTRTISTTAAAIGKSGTSFTLENAWTGTTSTTTGTISASVPAHGTVVYRVSGGGTTTRYEAETAPAVCTGTIDTNWSGYSGTGFCNGDNATGAYAQFTVNAASAGTATIAVRFANGTTTARAADLLVNGTRVQSVSFEGTGAWSTWVSKTLTVNVNQGSNTIRLNPTTAAGLPNVDYIELTPS